MKISCQTCASKYTIADEKVRGKSVKIKCKKCGASIVVGPENGSGAEGVGDWAVNVAPDDQRTLTLAQIAALYRDRMIDDDTYVWREGMADWLPIAEVAEVRAAVAGAHMDEDQPTRMAAVPAEVLALGGGFGAPAPAAGSPPVAARRADVPRPTGDLFGAPAPIEEDQATRAFDARDALRPPGGGFGAPAPAPLPIAAPAPARPTARPPMAASGGQAMQPVSSPPQQSPLMEPGDASGLIDIRMLQASLGGGGSAAAAKAKREEKIDDIFGVSAGNSPFDAPAPAPMLMALDLTAPSPPEPPPPAPVQAPVAAVAAPMPVMAPPPKKSSAGLLIGLVAGVMVLGGLATVGALVVTKKSGDKVADNTAVAADKGDKAPADKPAGDAPAGDAKPTVPTASAPSEATPAPTADAKEKEDEKRPKTAAELKKEKEEKKKQEEEKKKQEEEKAKKKEDEKKKEDDKKKEEEKPAPSGGGDGSPFDRAAAISSLNAAAGGAASCKKADGPTGSGRVSVTFAPSGSVTSANIEGPPFAGTSVGSCIANKFRGARVPAFGGSPVTVKKSFSIN